MSAKHFEHFMNHWQQLAAFQRQSGVKSSDSAVREAKAKLRAAARPVRARA